MKDSWSNRSIVIFMLVLNERIFLCSIAVTNSNFQRCIVALWLFETGFYHLCNSIVHFARDDNQIETMKAKIRIVISNTVCYSPSFQFVRMISQENAKHHIVHWLRSNRIHIEGVSAIWTPTTRIFVDDFVWKNILCQHTTTAVVHFTSAILSWMKW